MDKKTKFAEQDDKIQTLAIQFQDSGADEDFESLLSGIKHIIRNAMNKFKSIPGYTPDDIEQECNLAAFTGIKGWNRNRIPASHFLKFCVENKLANVLTGAKRLKVLPLQDLSPLYITSQNGQQEEIFEADTADPLDTLILNEELELLREFINSDILDATEKDLLLSFNGSIVGSSNIDRKVYWVWEKIKTKFKRFIDANGADYGSKGKRGSAGLYQIGEGS